MTTFNDRERDFEKKFQHDEDLKFRIIARRNRLLGEWAAQEMEMPEDGIAEYARQVVLADFDEPGDDDVVRKVLRDLEAAGKNIVEENLRAEMATLFEKAKKEIMEEEG